MESGVARGRLDHQTRAKELCLMAPPVMFHVKAFEPVRMKVPSGSLLLFQT